MNRLYIIRWYMTHGKNRLLLFTESWWNRSEMVKEMRNCSDWQFEMKEKNDAHEIWIAY